MHNHCINKLLNIEDVIVKNVVHANSFVKIHLITKPHEHTCPACSNLTSKVHNYRIQTIKDLPFQTKHCYLVLRKRRYICNCSKRFYENYSFLSRYLQRAHRLTVFITDSFHKTTSISHIAAQANVSSATVNRILDTISFSMPKLPHALSIDEFRGNSSTEKHQCILVDPPKHRVLDILLDRSQRHLIDYFKSIPRPDFD